MKKIYIIPQLEIHPVQIHSTLLLETSGIGTGEGKVDYYDTKEDKTDWDFWGQEE